MESFINEILDQEAARQALPADLNKLIRFALKGSVQCAQDLAKELGLDEVRTVEFFEAKYQANPSGSEVLTVDQVRAVLA